MDVRAVAVMNVRTVSVVDVGAVAVVDVKAPTLRCLHGAFGAPTLRCLHGAFGVECWVGSCAGLGQDCVICWVGSCETLSTADLHCSFLDQIVQKGFALGLAHAVVLGGDRREDESDEEVLQKFHG